MRKAIGPPEGDPIASRRVFGQPPSGASGVSWSATRSSGLMRTAAAYPPRVIVIRSCVPSRRSKESRELVLGPVRSESARRLHRGPRRRRQSARKDSRPPSQRGDPPGAPCAGAPGQTGGARREADRRPRRAAPRPTRRCEPARPPRTTTWRGDHAKREVRRQLGTSVSA
jgi:hypothetical protein